MLVERLKVGADDSRASIRELTTTSADIGRRRDAV